MIQMVAVEGAWVYKHIILGWVDSNDTRPWCCPNYDEDLRCRCQLPCYTCKYGRHQDGKCRTCTEPPADWELRPETNLAHPKRIKNWWQNPDKPQPNPNWTPVWLADRVCREICRCDCCHPHVPPTATEPVDLSLYELVPLFDAHELECPA
ncbi:hypothetical protein [Nonomuraea sp. NPDC049141]|uniref:hypothetical protein n=1 Tax=Nonomuraea sp. NPDC049141 TaxID=3155500 RepID=UPI0033D0A3EB